MTGTDIFYVLEWWATLFFIGASCIPLMLLFFPTFFDRGYIFGKIIGMLFLSYLTLVFGEMHIVPFTNGNGIVLLLIIAIINLIVLVLRMDILQKFSSVWKFFILEELLFLAGLFIWSFVRGNAPDIHGLEKYMDYGFVNSIGRSMYFPPKDMWYPPFSINYYYFGHLTTAVLTKLSNIPSEISFNLMLATIFSFTFSCAFSLGANFLQYFFKQKLSLDTAFLPHTVNGVERRNKSVRSHSIEKNQTTEKKQWTRKSTIITGIGAVLTAYLLTFAGNLHTIYTFFKPYENENPVPFWQRPFSPSTFPNNYWYPNATRFIYHTIHEFPIYSFVVSDLHGHVLDIPFVFLCIAILFSFFIRYNTITGAYKLFITISLGILLAVMYMTNAWDGIIYFLLTALIFCFLSAYTEMRVTGKRLKQIIFNKDYILDNTYFLAITFISFILFSLPFSLFFKPFASQIGILCAPKFLTDIGHLGPFLFEVDHCQHSPLYQILILYGFFFWWILGFTVFLLKSRKRVQIFASDYFILLLSTLSVILIILPEFVYLKDIYPAHYRANTMFKLVYQSFIMMSLACGYIIIRLLTSISERSLGKKTGRLFLFGFLPIGAVFLVLVSIYPYFAVNSYYGNLQIYYGLDGMKYLQRLYPSDYEAIKWINQNISGQQVILEAQGDSYTDYARVSANTGLPTPLGWTVHEWLWRGSYNPLPERINDIQQLYETNDTETAKTLARKYKISLVFVGDLEKKKYTNLNDNKFQTFGKIIYQKGGTIIYQIQP